MGQISGLTKVQSQPLCGTLILARGHLAVGTDSFAVAPHSQGPCHSGVSGRQITESSKLPTSASTDLYAARSASADRAKCMMLLSVVDTGTQVRSMYPGIPYVWRYPIGTKFSM